MQINNDIHLNYTTEISVIDTTPIKDLPKVNREAEMVIKFNNSLTKFLKLALKKFNEISVPKVEYICAPPGSIINYLDDDKEWHKSAHSSGEIGFVIRSYGNLKE